MSVIKNYRTAYIACGLVSIIWLSCSVYFGFLLPPFLQNQSAVVSDLTSVGCWGSDFYLDGGVYLPVVILISQILTVGSCTELDLIPTALLFLLSYLSVTFFGFISLRRRTMIGSEWPYFFVLSIFCLPFLFGFERGNLIAMAPGLVFIGLSTRSHFYRTLICVILVSLKIYFILLIPFLVRNPFRSTLMVVIGVWFLNAVVATFIVSDFSWSTWFLNLVKFSEVRRPILDVINLSYSIHTTVTETAWYFNLDAARQLFTTGWMVFSVIFYLYLLRCSFRLGKRGFTNIGQSKIELLCVVVVFLVLALPNSGGYTGALLLIPLVVAKLTPPVQFGIVLMIIPVDVVIFGYWGNANSSFSVIFDNYYAPMNFVTLGAFLRPLGVTVLLLVLFRNLVRPRKMCVSQGDK